MQSISRWGKYSNICTLSNLPYHLDHLTYLRSPSHSSPPRCPLYPLHPPRTPFRILAHPTFIRLLDLKTPSGARPAYCVASNSDPPTTTSVASSTTSGATTSTSNPKPTATREGIAANYNRWAMAESGIGCWDMANNAGIDLSLFYTWNPILGPAGEKCGTEIWPDYYYSIGVSGSTTSQAPTSTSLTTPKPTNTQAGIPCSCTKFYEAKSGDSCWQVANDNGIELSLFYSLNPVLGAGGEDCGTMLWPKYFYCIATS